MIVAVNASDIVFQGFALVPYQIFHEMYVIANALCRNSEKISALIKA